MAEKKHNPRKDRFLQSLPKDEFVCDIAEARGKLSFSLKYFDGSQQGGQDFKDWNNDEKTKLLNKLKEYSKENKQYWLNQRTGSGGLKVLEIYGTFPRNSDFTHPRKTTFYGYFLCCVLGQEPPVLFNGKRIV